MSRKIELLEQEIKDIFAIPPKSRKKDKESNDYDIEDSEEVSKISFEDRVKELQDSIKKHGVDPIVLSSKNIDQSENNISKTENSKEEKVAMNEKISNEKLLSNAIGSKKDEDQKSKKNDLFCDDFFEEETEEEIEEKDVKNEEEKLEEKPIKIGKNDKENILKNDEKNEGKNNENVENSSRDNEEESNEENDVDNKEESIEIGNNLEVEANNNEDELAPKTNDKQVINHVQVVSGEIQWLLKSPSEKYNNFYKQKAEIIGQILYNGQIEYDRSVKELKNSSVDITVFQIYDLQEIYNKMREVQMKRDRVQEIALECNAQYFLWERAIELFHGLLARTEYIKPSQGREGLLYEHMRDMELYFSRLKAIHRSVDQVLKSLELTFECLSRQVTIAMQNKEPGDRYISQKNGNSGGISVKPTMKVEEKVNQNQVKKDFDLNGYDRLPNSPVEKKVVRKVSGEVNWSE